MNDIQKAVKVLRKGGIVIFPTDTAFGIGCRIDNDKAVQRLFEIRKRPKEMATPVLVSSLEMVKQYLKEISNEVITKLIKPYWPGALTIVLPCKVNKVPSLVRGGGKNLGVRVPNHKTALSIIRELGIPILGPSANFHGEKTPFKFEDLDPELIDQVDFVVHGETKLKKLSTVIDCSKKPWKIFREGAVEIKRELL